MAKRRTPPRRLHDSLTHPRTRNERAFVVLLNELAASLGKSADELLDQAIASEARRLHLRRDDLLGIIFYMHAGRRRLKAAEDMLRVSPGRPKVVVAEAVFQDIKRLIETKDLTERSACAVAVKKHKLSMTADAMRGRFAAWKKIRR